MLKTTLLPEPRSAALARYEVVARNRIIDLMKKLRGAGTMLSCFIEGGFIPAEARIDAVRSDPDRLILVAAGESDHALLARAGTITAVGFVDGVKVQFTTTVRGGADAAGAAGVEAALPARVLRLQRRAHGRVTPSRMQPLECMVRGERNVPTLQRLPVLDIGVNCHFDLGADGEITVDLEVRHAERAPGSGNWRYGCGIVRIDETDLERLCTYVERLVIQRAAPRGLDATEGG